MRYQHVAVEAFTCSLPPHTVTSEEIEDRLAPVYDRLALPAGRLELMTGIRERRFYDPGTTPGQVSAQTVRDALQAADIEPRDVGALVHGSVCRDQLEPATASGVHHAAGLPENALVLDVSNACLGLLNGIVMIADMIELGRIRAGVVVGTEVGRPLVEGTIDRLLTDTRLTRKDVKPEFASLTIGSGSAAVVLCDRKLSRSGMQLVGGWFQADTTSHQLCSGGVNPADSADHRPRMSTNSEALLHAGVNLAERAWPRFLDACNWQPTDVTRVVTHQVGRAHRRLLLERLSLPENFDYPTVEYLGNTGAAALPTAAALAIEHRHINPGDRTALLGIGSGLNVLMLGLDWAHD
ncbi:MAG: 3-oxoacyl-ACP synthase III [Planctomycetota bacterium]|nr:MAG: 3-oxoacyl-ACP synthase III [Planctomycetota bacterium]REJ86854.1 MAG: 3-oxoacyl-ACP synthase III [Planctomycetota bacterium]REK22793.1 MAG: 3-oxoacyl-ACP synthase III [Planctomycetota bacterium]REK33787.1 MAG: 3-oxoacyl-ACP synthase III [Planctomycetota bacterium]